MNLDESIQKHAEWKLKFRAAISRKEQMDADTIGKDNCCQLGGWLYGEGKLKYGAKPEFGAIVQKHKAFHTEAGKIARLINSQQYDLAEKEMGIGTAYSQASNAVGAAIIAFKRHL
ncbi:CZB domain-containing protein [Achromobacter xylosoxidans]|uniref:Chemotaxis protein n=1 Tax=Alcaligenes xylosoxydans xylosoxydans TaxID=85698 RepID=A0A109XX91_ALCXX|nr:CZB domain-containing protein [Achromobacter xylosoxidans]AMG38197.1 chemotaxis protein [Achromobacter xylosoxidans]